MVFIHKSILKKTKKLHAQNIERQLLSKTKLQTIEKEVYSLKSNYFNSYNNAPHYNHT